MTEPTPQPVKSSVFNLDDFFDAFNWFDRVDRLVFGALSLLPHRDLRGHWHVTPGLVDMRVARRDESGQIMQYGADAERLLARYAISIHGRRVRHAEIIFCVPAQQAAWAEYLLLRGGIQLAASHRYIDPRNARWAGRHAGPVPAWADRNQQPPTTDRRNP